LCAGGLGSVDDAEPEADCKCGNGKIGTVENAKVENTGVGISTRSCRGGKRRGGNIRSNHV